MTTTQKPTPDAVEALSDSLIDIDMCDLDGADYGTNALLAALKEKGFTITRAEPAPVGFDVAIKQLGEPDEATGHWSLDEGNLRWFVGQCRAAPSMSDAELEREANELSFLTRDFKCVVGIDDAIALAKKYRG